MIETHITFKNKNIAEQSKQIFFYIIKCDSRRRVD